MGRRRLMSGGSWESRPNAQAIQDVDRCETSPYRSEHLRRRYNQIGRSSELHCPRAQLNRTMTETPRRCRLKLHDHILHMFTHCCTFEEINHATIVLTRCVGVGARTDCHTVAGIADGGCNTFESYKLQLPLEPMCPLDSTHGTCYSSLVNALESAILADRIMHCEHGVIIIRFRQPRFQGHPLEPISYQHVVVSSYGAAGNTGRFTLLAWRHGPVWQSMRRMGGTVCRHQADSMCRGLRTKHINIHPTSWANSSVHQTLRHCMHANLAPSIAKPSRRTDPAHLVSRVACCHRHMHPASKHVIRRALEAHPRPKCARRHGVCLGH